MCIAWAGMVSVSMCDYGATNRTPGIDVKVTVLAVESSVSQFDEIDSAHMVCYIAILSGYRRFYKRLKRI